MPAAWRRKEYYTGGGYDADPGSKKTNTISSRQLGTIFDNHDLLSYYTFNYLFKKIPGKGEV